MAGSNPCLPIVFNLASKRELIENGAILVQRGLVQRAFVIASFLFCFSVDSIQRHFYSESHFVSIQRVFIIACISLVILLVQLAYFFSVFLL